METFQISVSKRLLIAPLFVACCRSQSRQHIWIIAAIAIGPTTTGFSGPNRLLKFLWSLWLLLEIAMVLVPAN